MGSYSANKLVIYIFCLIYYIKTIDETNNYTIVKINGWETLVIIYE